MEYKDTDQFDGTLFDSLPVGLVTIDRELYVKQANSFAASRMQLRIDQKLTDTIHGDDLQNFTSLTESEVGQSREIQLVQGDNSYYTRFKLAAQHHSGMTFVVEDISEIVALGRQLKSGRQPERKFIHEISNALTTTIGYTELINMMLDEHDEFSGERLGAIRRYEAEVFEGLKRADALIKDKRQGASQRYSPAIPLNRKHVVVVDDEPQITDFLSELLKARQYKVTAFTDGRSALDYYRNHSKEVDLVIMDQVMPEMSGISLATELLALDIELPIVLCTGDQHMIQEQSTGNLNIKHFLSKPIDINELTDMVSHLVDQHS